MYGRSWGAVAPPNARGGVKGVLWTKQSASFSIQLASLFQTLEGHMRFCFEVVAAAMLTLPIGMAVAQEMSADARIAEAVSPLPESLRADATVVTFDAKGNPKVLRQGRNGLTCGRLWPTPTEPFGVSCHTAAELPQHGMMTKLQASGKSHEEAAAEVAEAIESGKLRFCQRER
jgi:hypothetical protein